MMWVAIILIGGLIVFVVFLNTGAGKMLVSEGIDQAKSYNGDDASDDEDSAPSTPAPQPSAPASSTPELNSSPAPASSTPELNSSPAPLNTPAPPTQGPINLFSNSSSLNYTPPQMNDNSSANFSNTSNVNFSNTSSVSSRPFEPVKFEDESTSTSRPSTSTPSRPAQQESNYSVSDILFN